LGGVEWSRRIPARSTGGLWWRKEEEEEIGEGIGLGLIFIGGHGAIEERKTEG
jgi:hypothetical protein